MLDLNSETDEILKALNSFKAKYENSKYSKYVEHYWNNLLNLLLTKYEVSDILGKESVGKPEDLKKDILSYIKDLELLLEDKDSLECLKKYFDKWTYSNEGVLINIENLSKYIEKYYK